MKFFINRLMGRIFFLFAVLVLSEIFLMICGPRYYKFNNLSQEYYTNSRGYYYPIRKEGPDIIYGLKYKTDKNNYRLPDESGQYSRDKESSENALLILGDSFTFGRGVKYPDLYATRLETLLNRNGYMSAIKNCGVAGANLEEICKIYKKEARLKFFSLVIYGFVLNDFGLSGPEKVVGYDFVDRNNGGYQFSPLRKLWRLYNLICYFFDRRRLHNVTLKRYIDAFKGENVEQHFAMLKTLHQTVKENNAQLVVMVFPLLYAFEKYPFYQVHEKISNFCKIENIMTLDLLPAFSKFKTEDLWANPTDQHPNEIAHQIVSEELYNFLTRNKLLPVLLPVENIRGNKIKG